MDCVYDFIVSKGLHHLPHNSIKGSPRRVSVKATGGGAFKFADAFQVGIDFQELHRLSPIAVCVHSVQSPNCCTDRQLTIIHHEVADAGKLLPLIGNWTWVQMEIRHQACTKLPTKSFAS